MNCRSGDLTTRPLREETIRKEGWYGALGLGSGSWEHMGGRWDHFRCWRELEGEVELRLTASESLQTKTSLTALLPEVCYMGKLVVGEGVDSRGPRSLMGHGR